jgi:lysophospholipase L1-like esterase
VSVWNEGERQRLFAVHHGAMKSLLTIPLRLLAAFAVLGLGTATLARAESPRSPASRWQASFDQFAAADRQQRPAAGGVLFVGSSSIRLWDGLEDDFSALPVVIKRGFGGSRLSDCAEHLAQLVLPYQPRQIVVYAGDNDLAEGATPAEVLASFERFVQGVQQALPETRIAFLSIKPSPLREALLERARQTNDLVRAFAATQANLQYIDIYSKMLGADGQPRAELFGPDRLHLNRAGYLLWRQEIARHLALPPAPDAAAPRLVAGHAAP